MFCISAGDCLWYLWLWSCVVSKFQLHYLYLKQFTALWFQVLFNKRQIRSSTHMDVLCRLFKRTSVRATTSWIRLCLVHLKFSDLNLSDLIWSDLNWSNNNILSFRLFSIYKKKYSHVGLVWFVSMSSLLIFNYYNFYKYVMKDIVIFKYKHDLNWSDLNLFFLIWSDLIRS